MGKKLREQQIDVILQNSVSNVEKKFQNWIYLFIFECILGPSGGSINSTNSSANKRHKCSGKEFGMGIKKKGLEA